MWNLYIACSIEVRQTNKMILDGEKTGWKMAVFCWPLHDSLSVAVRGREEETQPQQALCLHTCVCKIMSAVLSSRYVMALAIFNVCVYIYPTARV